MDVLGLSDYSAPKLSVSREWSQWTKHDEKVFQALKMAHDHRRMLGSDHECWRVHGQDMPNLWLPPLHGRRIPRLLAARTRFSLSRLLS